MDAVVDIVDNHGTTIEPETSKLTDEDIDASTTSHREAIGFNVGLRKRLRNQNVNNFFIVFCHFLFGIESFWKYAAKIYQNLD